MLGGSGNLPFLRENACLHLAKNRLVAGIERGASPQDGGAVEWLAQKGNVIEMKATTVTALLLFAALASGPATAGQTLQFDGLRVVGNLPGSGPGSDLIEAWG